MERDFHSQLSTLDSDEQDDSLVVFAHLCNDELLSKVSKVFQTEMERRKKQAERRTGSAKRAEPDSLKPASTGREPFKKLRLETNTPSRAALPVTQPLRRQPPFVPHAVARPRDLLASLVGETETPVKQQDTAPVESTPTTGPQASEGNDDDEAGLWDPTLDEIFMASDDGETKQDAGSVAAGDAADPAAADPADKRTTEALACFVTGRLETKTVKRDGRADLMNRVTSAEDESAD